MIRRLWFGLALLLGCAVLVADIATKYFVHAHFPVINSFHLHYPYGGIGIFEDAFGVEFSIVHATNKGTIWGLFPKAQLLLLCLRLGIVTALLLAFRRLVRRGHSPFALMLILAGAIGNIVDYFAYGHVVDMFHFRFFGWSYPVFNVADASICLGIAWILTKSLLARRQRAVDER